MDYTFARKFWSNNNTRVDSKEKESPQAYKGTRKRIKQETIEKSLEINCR